MPIRREHRWLYPIDWPQISASVRFGRAQAKCEGCGRPHGREVKHLGDGRWWDEDAGRWRDGKGRRLPRTMKVDIAGVLITRVILATAHLDHDPGNSRPRNLKALCQRCHLINDREEHRRRRRVTYLARRALGDLFLGPYRSG